MTTFTTEDRIIAEKDGSFTINVEGSPPHIVDSGASVMFKEITDEEVLQIASELKLVHYYGESGDWSGVTNEDMIEKEKHTNNQRLLEILKPFANAVLKRSQEK